MSASYATGFERVFDNPAGRHILTLTHAAQRRTADAHGPRIRVDADEPAGTPQPREKK